MLATPSSNRPRGPTEEQTPLLAAACRLSSSRVMVVTALHVDVAYLPTHSQLLTAPRLYGGPQSPNHATHAHNHTCAPYDAPIVCVCHSMMSKCCHTSAPRTSTAPSAPLLLPPPAQQGVRWPPLPLSLCGLRADTRLVVAAYGVTSSIVGWAKSSVSPANWATHRPM